MAMDTSAGPEMAQMPFIKNLASSDRKLREASLEALTAFLVSTAHRRGNSNTGVVTGGLTDGDARKLWTGLYYALWMTDRPRPQQALAADLAALVLRCLRRRPGCARAWLRGFWYVVGARWTSIEALRLDKFLVLVRRVFAAMVEYAMAAETETETDEKQKQQQQQQQHKQLPQQRRDVVLDVWREYCFDGDNGGGASPYDESSDAPPRPHPALPLGLRLHVLDIWVDELQRAGLILPQGGQDGGRQAQGDEELVAALGNQVEALTRDIVKPIRERAQESYNDERLPWATKEAMSVEGDDDDDEDGDGDEWGGIED